MSEIEHARCLESKWLPISEAATLENPSPEQFKARSFPETISKPTLLVVHH